MNKTVKRNVGNAFIYVILIAVSITMLFPFLWMISTSLKSKMDAQVFPPQWIPNPIITDAYVDVWKVAPLLSGMGNSLIIAVPVLFFGTLCSAMAAFAFAKMDIPKRNLLFMGLLSSMMIPRGGHYDPTVCGLGTAQSAGHLYSPDCPRHARKCDYDVFFRQYLSGVPNELVDAGKDRRCRMDDHFHQTYSPDDASGDSGAGDFLVYGNLERLPWTADLSRFRGKVYGSIALRLLNSMSEATSEYPIIMAGAVISCLPLLLLFVVFQRYFVDSMLISGVKG